MSSDVEENKFSLEKPDPIATVTSPDPAIPASAPTETDDKVPSPTHSAAQSQTASEDIPDGDALLPADESGSFFNFGVVGEPSDPNFSISTPASPSPDSVHLPSGQTSLTPLSSPTLTPAPVSEVYMPPPPVNQTGVVPTSAELASFMMTNSGQFPSNVFNLSSIIPQPQTATPFQPPEGYQPLSAEERAQRKQQLEEPLIKQKFDELCKAVDVEYENIHHSDVSTNASITNHLHQLLSESRFLLLNYNTSQLYKIEWNIEQVRAILDRANESQNLSKYWGIPLMVWGFFWFVIFVYFIFSSSSLAMLFNLPEDRQGGLISFEYLLRTILFGGIGGIAAVYYSLPKYISGRVYDPEFNFSYFVKPFMGMIMGVLVYLMVFAVMRLLSVVSPLDIVPGATDETSLVQVFLGLTWFIALASGFKENVAFDLLDWVICRVFNREQTKPASTMDTSAQPYQPKTETKSSTESQTN